MHSTLDQTGVLFWVTRYCLVIILSIFITFFIKSAIFSVLGGEGRGATSSFVQFSIVHFKDDVMSYECINPISAVEGGGGVESTPLHVVPSP